MRERDCPFVQKHRFSVSAKTSKIEGLTVSVGWLHWRKSEQKRYHPYLLLNLSSVDVEDVRTIVKEQILIYFNARIPWHLRVTLAKEEAFFA